MVIFWHFNLGSDRPVQRAHGYHPFENTNGSAMKLGSIDHIVPPGNPYGFSTTSRPLCVTPVVPEFENGKRSVHAGLAYTGAADPDILVIPR